MKAPYRYLIGIVTGLAAGFLLKTGTAASGFVDSVIDLSMRLGRYFLFPLIFFSLPVAVTRLRRLDKLGFVLRHSIIYTAVSGAVLTVAGTLLFWMIDLGRIPVIPGTRPDFAVEGLGKVIAETIQMNGFRVLMSDASFILPLFIPAFILGWHMYHDREVSEPVFNFFDSFSRLIYRANRFMLILMPGMLAFFTAGAVMQVRSVVDFSRFLPILIFLFVITLIIIGLIFPLALWAAGGRRSPWKTLSAMSGAFLGALVSASVLFNYGNLTRHLKENLKIPRHSAALLAPAFVMFARAGTAMITSICMLSIIRSYSSLEITLFQASWTAVFSFLISFILPMTPDRGLTASLIIMGALYGRGLSDGWLILVPALPLIAMLTAVLDTAAATLLLLLVNRKAGLEEGDSAAAMRF